MIAVGVADTGPGLTSELLDKAKTGLFSSDSKTLNSGAKNSGFGLHLAHQLAGTLETEVYLTDLNHFHHLCGEEMLNALENEEAKEGEGPGPGTVLYITLPVFQDVDNGKKFLDSGRNPDLSREITSDSQRYTFSPKPALDSPDGCFNVLVADDVTMLRKGLSKSILDIFSKFPDCPVSISTACTAEDALRAVASHSFDLFICDNQFAAPDNLKKASIVVEQGGIRPRILSNDGRNLREIVVDFFANEKFTIEAKDGLLTGVDALSELAVATNPSFPTPILILHSGHEIELPRDKGVIVVQKPLKRSEFVSVIESHASFLVETGICFETSTIGQNETEIAVLNKRGSQIFTRKLAMNKY